MQSIELKDYLKVIKRRKKILFSVTGSIIVITAIIALKLSNYRSTAIVEVTAPEVSQNTTVPSGMSTGDYSQSLVDLRISRLQQRVLSPASLGEIITKYNLYASARANTTMAELADRMAKKIKIDLVGSTLANPSSASKASAQDLSAIAFTVSFDYNKPEIAQQVTDELVSRFLDEDMKERRKIAHETSTFLESQIKTLEKAMEEQEAKIAEFRIANGDVHPESLAFNQQASQSLLMSLQNIDTQISTNDANINSLRSQLVSLDPYSRIISDGQVLTTPRQQLKALRTQYATLSAQYGSEHPDVVKISRQINGLKKQVGSSTEDSADTGEIKSRISDTQANLNAALKSYGPDHPDVAALKNKLATLKKELKEAGSSKSASAVSDADNPAYIQAAASLKTAEEQRKALMNQKDELLKQQKKFQKALESNPVAEQKLASIARDYENSQMRYRELKAKKMSADMSQTIELDRNGQRLQIISPPDLPMRTYPSRILLVAVGLLLAVLGGIVSVVAAQLVSQTVMGPHHLESLVGVGPLVVVPCLSTAQERHARRVLRRRVLFWAGCFIVAVLLLSLLTPMGDKWYIFGQKLGL